MTNLRTMYRTGFAALMLTGVVLSSPAQAGSVCAGTLAQYTATIKQLEGFAAKAQAAAEQNPLLIADVEYYAAALTDAQRCAKSLGTVATAAR
jgi:hypothetical protein